MMNRFNQILRYMYKPMVSFLDADHRTGLKLFNRELARHKFTVLATFAANIVSAIFEGSSIGILAIAVTTLTTQDLGVSFDFAPPVIRTPLIEWSQGLTTSTVFLALILFAVIAQILRSIFYYVSRRISIRLERRITQGLQEIITSKIMTMSYQTIDQYPSGFIESLIRQAGRMAGLISALNTLLLGAVLFTVYCFVMYKTSPSLTGVSFLLIVILSVGLTIVVRRLALYGKKMVVADIDTSRLTVEYLQLPRLLRVFNATKYAEKRMNMARNEALMYKEKANLTKIAVDPVVDIITMISAAAFLIAGFFLAGDQSPIVVANLLVFLLIFYRMIPQIKLLNQSRFVLAHVLPSLKVVAQFYSRETDIRWLNRGETCTDINQPIHFNNVTFRYPETQRTALSDLTFSIPPHKTTAIVGSSGSGKSTLLSLLLRLYSPTDGQISLGESDVSSISVGSWLDCIGTVDQDTYLIDSTVSENISFATDRHSQDDIIEAAKMARAHQFIMGLPKQYDTIIGERGHLISGGEKQRLSLARAFLRSPSLLVLDEPTSSLDAHIESEILSMLNEQQHLLTIFIIAHRLSTIRNADQIIVMDNGKIVELGTFEALQSKQGAFQKMWAEQYRRNVVDTDINFS